MEPFLNKGRNVICDNYFTSIKLTENLKSKRISLLGTMNCVRREIPVNVKTFCAELYDTQVLKNNDITLTVYQSKVNKNVLILSSLHPKLILASRRNLKQ